MTHSYILSIIALLFCITCVTRALPFMLGKKMQESKLVLFLGKRLPITVILLLCIYYVIVMAMPSHGHNLPWQLIALAATLLVHWRWRNITISIFVGTSIYLLLNHLIVF